MRGAAQALPLDFKGLSVPVAGLGGGRDSTHARHSVVVWPPRGHAVYSGLRNELVVNLTVPNVPNQPAMPPGRGY